MNELAFPLFGAMIVFLVVVPAATVLAKAALIIRRRMITVLPRYGSNTIWLLIIAPVIAPVPWFISAALHQSEPGRAFTACLYDHLGSEACHDALGFAFAVTALLLYAFARRIQQETRPTGLQANAIPWSSTPARRLRHLCAAHPRLRGLRVSAVRGTDHPIYTHGLLRPQVAVSIDLCRCLDDEALTAALLHEAEHAHALDPLRYLISSVCLSLNPLAALLRPEMQRWRLAREAACDEEAVRAGGEPLSLAHAIVAAATLGGQPTPAWSAHLDDGGTGGVRVRVGLLLDYADGRTAGRRREAPFLVLTLLLSFILTLPHAAGSGPLDSIHLGIERALALLVG